MPQRKSRLYSKWEKWICQMFSENSVFRNIYFLTEPRASQLLGKCSTIWTMSSVLILSLGTRTGLRMWHMGGDLFCMREVLGSIPSTGINNNRTLGLRLGTPWVVCAYEAGFRALFSSSPSVFRFSCPTSACCLRPSTSLSAFLQWESSRNQGWDPRNCLQIDGESGFPKHPKPCPTMVSKTFL